LKKRECEQQKERWRNLFKNKNKNWIEKKNWRGRVIVRKRESNSKEEGEEE
jgi:hypothetical protein